MSSSSAIVAPTWAGRAFPRTSRRNSQNCRIPITSRSLTPLTGTDARTQRRTHTRYCKTTEDTGTDSGGGAEISRNSELDTIIAYLQDLISELEKQEPSKPERQEPVEDSSWHRLHGSTNWDGLLEPLDANLREELVRCGNLIQSAYNAFYSNFRAPRIVLPDSSYVVTKPLYATPSVKWMSSVAPWIAQGSGLIGYVAVCNSDHEINRMGRRDIVIVLRGTATFLEWAENLRICLVRVTGSSKVGTGFLSLYKTSAPSPDSSSLSSMVLEELRRLTEKFREEELSITVTGHSLGGVLALLIADELSECLAHVPPIAVFSFASPKVGNQAFADRLEKKGVGVLRVVNSNDIIPRMPWFFTRELCRKIWHAIGGYVHLGTELRVGSRFPLYLETDSDPFYCHSLSSHLHLVKIFISKDFQFESEWLYLKKLCQDQMRAMGFGRHKPMQAVASSEPAKELSLMEQFVREKILLRLGSSFIKLHNIFSNLDW